MKLDRDSYDNNSYDSFVATDGNVPVSRESTVHSTATTDRPGGSRSGSGVEQFLAGVELDHEGKPESLEDAVRVYRNRLAG